MNNELTNTEVTAKLVKNDPNRINIKIHQSWVLMYCPIVAIYVIQKLGAEDTPGGVVTTSMSYAVESWNNLVKELEVEDVQPDEIED